MATELEVLVSEQSVGAGISAEELAAMDPKRAKRLIANRQACSFFPCYPHIRWREPYGG